MQNSKPDLANLINYKVEFDFGNLISLLTKTTENFADKDLQISELRKEIFELKNENNGINEKIENIGIECEQNKISLQNYMNKLLEFDNNFGKAGTDTKTVIIDAVFLIFFFKKYRLEH